MAVPVVFLYISQLIHSHSSNHRARNLIGEKTLNYTLEVRPTAGATHAIVTEVAGPANTTVAEGDTATLACRY